MSTYDQFYARLTSPFHQRPFLIKGLSWLNQLITRGFMVGIYPACLSYQGLTQGWQTLHPYLLVPAIGFVSLTVMRKLFNRPRPYEDWDIQPLLGRHKQGQSFPSRHVFSAVLISCCVWQSAPFWGWVCFWLAGLLAACRVLGGVHYPRDVVVAYALGLAYGGLFYLWP